ncbi:N-acetylmuramoyl-L-alanine amidase [Epilithonimonas ginsengisoli]|uniref:N-acetylmuramoyl-L-alanine amidase n=1 Tax=Epilithonimonas ginsengisoli TaxID=1245592 RepID=A0ABU4JGV5_9FLAO|nr:MULTISPECIES: SH3 domain-containing protein [Chryseobacterium group]MBV6878755.1 amidase [Epilithonimonas sp. FP105]MDW8548914.1 N-acetylmuramoyl-L-alanine amidase [Epilithonimonas ginsengisoli]OAH75602.1 N-acetylmuramoyl-L-alanine amidase [Chryseobacterium sp. FP211-J200]
METKYGFTKMTSTEFESYISKLKIARTVLSVQQHHTYIPSYNHFNGKNHLELQKGMKNTHINANGWADIGQHISIFPDGSVVTGRSFEKSPACIYGSNANHFCIENVGNFDKGGDQMTTQQREAIITVTAALLKKFGLIPNTNTIVYHHWFNLSTGARNNGSGNNKSCPGSNFFGGNKVEDCNRNFIPLIAEALSIKSANPTSKVLKYVVVNTETLNIRTGPSSSNAKVKDRKPELFGSVLRVYKEKDGWFKVSSSAEHLVSGRFTNEVKRALVKSDILNVRAGAGTSFPKVGSLDKGTEVFIYSQKDGWSQIAMDDQWVKDSFIELTS